MYILFVRLNSNQFWQHRLRKFKDLVHNFQLQLRAAASLKHIFLASCPLCSCFRQPYDSNWVSRGTTNFQQWVNLALITRERCLHQTWTT